MQILALSDIHLEFEPWQCDALADVIILAGDIHEGVQGIEWAARTFPPSSRVLYVAGNHEFYGASLPDLYEELRSAAAAHDHVTFLECEYIDLLGYRFLGCTLWTDFAILGDPESGMDTARVMMNDYNMIDFGGVRMLEPEDVQALHHRSRQWLQEELARARSEQVPAIVITHHCPASQSVPERFRGHPLNGAFASDLAGLITQGTPQLWVHGHTHDRFDYRLGSTRIFCNPVGYPEERREDAAAAGLIRLEPAPRPGQSADGCVGDGH